MNSWPVKFCIFDTSETGEVERLADAFILEMVLLYDHTDLGDNLHELARLFAVSGSEVWSFFHGWTSAGGKSLAELWAEDLYVPPDEALSWLTTLLSSVVWRAQLAREEGEDFVNFTANYLTDLELAMGTRDAELAGVNSPEELDDLWSVSCAASDILEKMLSRKGEEGACLDVN